MSMYIFLTAKSNNLTNVNTILFFPSFLDEPDASSAPVVEAIDKSSATLAWSPPASDGGSPVTGYHVEMKSPGSKEWTRVNPFPIRESGYVVPNLKEGQEYQFRVLAENEAGEGKPSRSSEPVVAKDPICKLEMLL